MGTILSKQPLHHPKEIDPKISSRRESIATWCRPGLEVTDVYDITDVLGHGHMGEICVAVRKEGGTHRHEKKNSTSSLVKHHSMRLEKNIQKVLGIKISRKNHKKDLSKSESTDSSDDDSLKDTEHSQRVVPEPSSSRRMYACKTVSTARMKLGQMQELLNEVNIMRQLDHPHILQLFEVYHTKRKIWLIMELCTGGDLFSRPNLTEEGVSIVMEQICRAVAYIHKMGVCHRDIKLENILYEHPGPDAGIKLIDFGLSQNFARGAKMLRACGTVYSIAPELVNGKGYTEKSDIWGIGVVAYVLLSSGEFPFLRDEVELNNPQKRDQLLHAKYVFGPAWKEKNISKYGKEFVHKCLRKHPGIRWTASEALDFIHNEWIPALEQQREKNHRNSLPSKSEQTNSTTTATSEIQTKSNDSNDNNALTNTIHRRSRQQLQSLTLQGIQKFCQYGLLQKTILMTMAYTMEKSSLTQLKDLFLEMDTEGTGTISVSELKTTILKMHSDKDINDENIEYIFESIDLDNSGQIHYSEFLAAVAESQGLITMERLAEAFDRIDFEGKGYISKEDIYAILGTEANESLVNKMIDEADYKNNGQVDYDEFLRLMFKNPEEGMDAVSRQSSLWIENNLSFTDLEQTVGNTN